MKHHGLSQHADANQGWKGNPDRCSTQAEGLHQEDQSHHSCPWGWLDYITMIPLILGASLHHDFGDPPNAQHSCMRVGHETNWNYIYQTLSDCFVIVNLYSDLFAIIIHCQPNWQFDSYVIVVVTCCYYIYIYRYITQARLKKPAAQHLQANWMSCATTFNRRPRLCLWTNCVSAPLHVAWRRIVVESSAGMWRESFVEQMGLNASFGFKVINSDCLTVRIYIIFGFFYPILAIDRLHYLFCICCLSSQVTTTLHEHQMTLLRCHEDLRQHHQNEKSVLQDLQVCWMCRWTWMGWAKVPWCFIIYPRSTQNIPKWKHNIAGWHYDISISIEIGHPSCYSTFVLLLSVFHDKGEEGAAQGGPPWQDVCPAYRDFAATDCQLASQSYRLKSLNFVRALRIWTASRMRPHASTANQAQPSADSVCPKLWRLTAPKSQRVWMQDLRSTQTSYVIQWFCMNIWIYLHDIFLCIDFQKLWRRKSTTGNKDWRKHTT